MKIPKKGAPKKGQRMHQILKPLDYRIMPWRNGQGTTVEIAIDPPGQSSQSSQTQFNWRLSIATIGISGPFSAFPGYDRTLVPLAGGAVTLTHEIPGQSPPNPPTSGPLKLFQPYRFSGDWQTSCDVTDNMARDFNVMTNRQWGKTDVHSKIIPADDQVVVTSNANIAFLVCIATGVKVSIPKGPEGLFLDVEETLRFDRGSSPLPFSFVVESGPREGRLLIVELFAKR